MPQLPLPPDFGRHIPGISSQVEEPQEELPEIGDEMVENPDGSVTIKIEESIEIISGFDDNLADALPEDELAEIAFDLLESIEKDKEARKKRDKQYEEGIRRTGLGDDAPGGAQFEGASRVVHPVLAEACVDYASRAIKELFPSNGPVKTKIIGKETPQKLDRAERKRTYMNWQLTEQMPEYKTEIEQLLTQLPLGGSQYLKIWYDTRMNRPVCEFLPIDDIFLPYACTNFYTAQRVTHHQQITRMEYQRRVTSGLYRDINLTDKSDERPDQSASAIASDKIEGRELDSYNEDGLRSIYEITCWYEIDGDDISDGQLAPYVITIDESTEEVLAIRRNWEEGDDSLEKLDWMVEFKFIPWRGAYAIGLPHLIGGLAAALTGALRALLDSAHINNSATMLKLKAGRVTGQNTQVEVTQIAEIEGPAGIDDVRKLAMPMPFNQPSPVLFQLLDWCTGQAKSVVATADEKLSQVGDRTPVGTTMAMIEQGSATYSAIHARLHDSQKKCLQILARINKDYLDEEEVIEDLGESIVTRADFAGSLDVIPVSDPSIFSEAQRFAQAQAILQMMQQDAPDQSIPWNKIEARKRMLRLMHVENPDDLLKEPPKPFTADAMAENDTAMHGRPIEARTDQDHLSHIQSHMAYLSAPLNLQNPLVPGPALMQLLTHVQQHIQMLTLVLTHQAQQVVMGQNPGMTEDQATAQAVGMAQQRLTQQLGPVMQQIMQVQQAIQKKMPPPPMPPEVQASIQIAQMDTQRKTQEFQATMQMKQAEMQGEVQKDQAEFQAAQQAQQFAQMMEQQQMQFDQYIKQVEQQRLASLDAGRLQIEQLQNEMDNRQKQVTELLKNRDDNLTNLIIERMKLGAAVQDEGPLAPLPEYVTEAQLSTGVANE